MLSRSGSKRIPTYILRGVDTGKEYLRLRTWGTPHFHPVLPIPESLVWEVKYLLAAKETL